MASWASNSDWPLPAALALMKSWNWRKVSMTSALSMSGRRETGARSCSRICRFSASKGWVRCRSSAFRWAGGVITKKVADEALTALEIDHLGLDAIDHRMLRSIIENYKGGPVGLETLAATINEEAVTLEDVYEPYLIQLGFLTRTPRGRCVTPKAYQHLGLSVPGLRDVGEMEQLSF